MIAAGASAAEAGREAARGSAVRLLAELGSRLLTFVTTLLVGRGLGLKEYGEFGAILAMAVVAAELFDLGLHGTAQRAVVAGDLSLGSMLRAKRALLAAAGLATVALGSVVPVVALFVAFFAASGWAEFAGVALRGLGHRSQEALVLLVARAGALLAVVIALAAGGGLTGVAMAHALSPLPAVVLGLALLRRVAPAEPSPPAPVARVLATSWPMAINGGLALLNMRAEFLVLWVLCAPEQAGLFNAALPVIQVLNAAPTAVAAGAMPALTREATAGGRGARTQTALLAALLAAPCTLGLLLTAPEVNRLLFGSAFAGAEAPLRVLALSLPLLFMGQVRTHALLAAGRASALPRLTLLRLGLAVTLATLLAPPFGATGAAFGFLASEALLLVLAGRLGRAAGFDVPVLRPLAIAFAAALPMALGVMALGKASVVAKVALGAIVYGATLLAARPWLTGGPATALEQR